MIYQGEAGRIWTPMRVWNKRGLFERPVFPPQEFFQMFRRRLRIPWDGKSQVLPSFPLGRVFGASEGVLKFADFLHGWRPRVFSRGGGADEEPTCRSIEAHLRWLGKGIPVAAMPTSCDLPSDADQLQYLARKALLGKDLRASRVRIIRAGGGLAGRAFAFSPNRFPSGRTAYR